MADSDSDEARVLRPLQAAACTYRIAFGPRAGRKVLTLQGAIPREASFKQSLCADIDGFSLHAAVRCSADDRQALEQLCRNCGGEVKIIAAILEQPVIEKILAHLGLQARAPPRTPARGQALQAA